MPPVPPSMSARLPQHHPHRRLLLRHLCHGSAIHAEDSVLWLSRAEAPIAATPCPSLPDRKDNCPVVWYVGVIIRYPLRNKDKGVCRTHEGVLVRYQRKVGMTSSQHGPYGLGQTRATMAMTMKSKVVRRSNLQTISV